MLINLNEVTVKGLARGSLYNPGDWYIIPEENGYGNGALVFDVPAQDYNGANMYMQACSSPFRNRYNLSAAGLNGIRYSEYNSPGIASFWRGTFYAFEELLNTKLSNTVYYGNRDHRGEHPTTVDGICTKVLDYAVEIAAGIGLKMHPKALKAMQEFMQAVPGRVEEARKSQDYQDWLSFRDFPETSLNALVHLTYCSSQTSTGWGTFIDDVVQVGTGEVSGYYCNDLRRLYFAGKSLLEDFLSLHLYYSNSQFWPVGYGFQDGNPVLVLGKFNPDMSIRTQVVRVGRYFSSFDGIVDIRDSINDLKMLNQQLNTHLCMTEREWHDGYNGGVSSCMAKFNFDSSPVRVYATTSHGLPDNNLRLFISYTGELFGEDFRVTARAIVNIEKQQYVRAYGNNADAVLRAAGYTHDTGCTDGCILAKIDGPHYGYLMPYQDGDADRVDNLGGCWELRSGGEYDACDADGILDIEEDELEDDEYDDEEDAA